ncbi:MAG: cysteine hydrolase [Deltaproteobacteria bacterium]
MNHCLLLIDLQNDYFPGGKMELAGMEQAAKNACLLLTEFRNNKLPVIHIQHIAAARGASFFIPGTDGAEINAGVAPLAHENIIVKHYPNSFHHTSLLETLQKMQIDQLVMCGAMSHMCIDATVRAAFDLGFQCVVAEDACATRDLVFQNRPIKSPDVHAAFMAALSFPYAKIASTKDIVKSLA